MDASRWGKNIIIGKNVTIGENVYIGHNCIIEDDVAIGDNSFIDNNTILRSFTSVESDSNIGCNCIIGEYLMDFYNDHQKHEHWLKIGHNALIRSGSIIYTDSTIGDNFQTGHQVTIRENSVIGNNVSIGTLSDIQGNCRIGNYVRIHSHVFVAPLSCIDGFVWIFPYVVLTNDPTPPSKDLIGVHINSFAVLAAGSIILPGLELGQDCLIGAGSIVTKSVDSYAVVVGNPGKQVSDIRQLKSKKTGESVYPWRDHFSKYMPWDEGKFAAWYSSLDLEDITKYSIQ